MKSSKFKPTTVKIGNVEQFLVTLYQMKTRLFLISPSLFSGRANKVCTSATTNKTYYKLFSLSISILRMGASGPLQVTAGGPGQGEGGSYKASCC
jgi:hypothetical protein